MIQKPEKITKDSAPLGSYNVGDCYEDANGNGKWDASGGKTGFGTADDIVQYTVRVGYKPVTPFLYMIGRGDDEVIEETTVLRNQPFTSRATPGEKCD